MSRDGMLESGGIGMAFTCQADVKPEEVSVAAAGIDTDFKPLVVAQMTAGTTHVQHEITGTIVKAGIFTGGIYFVLADVLDRYVKIGVYNIPGANGRVARRQFPVGRVVSVREPYLKKGMDGVPFIRVDAPLEVRA